MSTSAEGCGRLRFMGECVAREPLGLPRTLFLEEALPYELVQHVVQFRVFGKFLHFEHVLVPGRPILREVSRYLRAQLIALAVELCAPLVGFLNEFLEAQRSMLLIGG